MRSIDADEFEVFAYDAKYATEAEQDAFDDGVQFVLERIDAAPTLDMTAITHGKWVRTSWQRGEEFEYKCSECKRFKVWKKKRAKLPNYCERCGAKMEGIQK